MSGRHEGSAVPARVLGVGIDKLLAERADLEDRRSEAFSVFEQAEQTVGPAKRADRQAYAKAIRSKNGADPGKANETKAVHALEQAQRTLAGLRTALDQNQADIVGYIEGNEDTLISDLQAASQAVRATALGHLNGLSQTLLEFGQLQGLVVLVQQPLTQSGDKLRTWTSDPVRVEIETANGERMQAQRVIDLLGLRLERGSPGVELKLAAHEAWGGERHHFVSVERIDRGALKTNKVNVLDIKTVGLVRYQFVRRTDIGTRQFVDLIVTAERDAQTAPTELFRDSKSAIETAFEDNTRFVVSDEDTRAVLAAMVPGVSGSGQSGGNAVRGESFHKERARAWAHDEAEPVAA